MALVKMNWHPSTRILRQFGMLVLPLVCGLFALKTHHINIAGGLAVMAFTVGLARPQWLRGLFVGLTLVTFPVGWLVSYAILTLLFFAVFVPAAAIMKLIGHDPMARKLDRKAKSYWIVRKGKSEISRYFRQF
jgi:hypothetical protein